MKKRAKKTLKVSLQLFARLILATILCAVLYVSMNVIATSFFSDVVGYRLFTLDADNNSERLGDDWMYADGAEEKKYDDFKYTYYLPDSEEFVEIKDEKEVPDDALKIQMVELRETPATTQKIFNVVTQILLLVLLGIFPYHILWNFGNRDDTNVQYRGQRPDPWRGVKVGALASVPFILFWVVLFVINCFGAAGVMIDLYKISVFPYAVYTNWAMGAVTPETVIAWWRLLLLLPIYLFVPAVSGISYRFGGRHFSIAEFMTFKKKETVMDEEI